MTKCFLIIPTGIHKAYQSFRWGVCPANPFGMIHRQDVVYSQGDKVQVEALYRDSKYTPKKPESFTCEFCGEVSPTATTEGGGMHETWYRPDTNEAHDDIRSFGVGAMYYADWYKMDNGKYGWDWDNLTEPPLHVVTPGGEWNIDSRCSNCGRPDDKKHRCWVRHGEPPVITVDKNGDTCSAGAGSIICGNYHGFLRNGYLTD